MKLKSNILVLTLFIILAPISASATLLNYDLSWTGDSGYSLSGAFAFDDTSIGGDNLVTQVDMLNFSYDLYDNSSNLIKSYNISTMTSFLFSFHTDTLLIDQGPGFDLQLGAIGTSDFILIRANGCTGDSMLLYQGDGGCPGTQLDHNGFLTASVASVPEPSVIALMSLGLLGFVAIRRKRNKN